MSGTITRFYLDWRSGVDRSFELAADLYGSVGRAYPLLLALFLGSDRAEYAGRRRDLDSQGNGRLHASIYRNRAGRESLLTGTAGTPS